MSPRASSSDFGLYKEKLKENKLRSIKFIFIIITTVPFLLLILYGVSTLLNREPEIESTIEKPSPNAEKLVVAQSIQREFYQNSPPKPFGVTFRGQPPADFTSTTEKITTLHYPQLDYRHRQHPNNIQEVIGYGGRFHPRYTQSQSRNVPQNQRTTRNFSLDENDPFYSYKPQEPGDVNLLATSSLRFAPPIWSNLKPKTQIPRAYFPQENTHRQEVYNPNKPLRVTLNVYPNEIEKQGLRQFINHRIENLQSKIRFPEAKHKKMVIHLNLYPDDFRQGESKMYRNVLTTPAQ